MPDRILSLLYLYYCSFPIIDGKPTGSIRISFGHYSTIKDANFVIQLIKDYFMTDDRKSSGKVFIIFMTR